MKQRPIMTALGALAIALVLSVFVALAAPLRFARMTEPAGPPGDVASGAISGAPSAAGSPVAAPLVTSASASPSASAPAAVTPTPAPRDRAGHKLSGDTDIDEPARS